MDLSFLSTLFVYISYSFRIYSELVSKIESTKFSPISKQHLLHFNSQLGFFCQFICIETQISDFIETRLIKLARNDICRFISKKVFYFNAYLS